MAPAVGPIGQGSGRSPGPRWRPKEGAERVLTLLSADYAAQPHPLIGANRELV